ncbi:unnamed protein product [Choristocarpus tenellus]
MRVVLGLVLLLYVADRSQKILGGSEPTRGARNLLFMGPFGPNPVEENCHNDIERLCAEEHHRGPPTLVACLRDNFANLSESCADAVAHKTPQKGRSELIPGSMLEAENKHLTRGITGLSIVLLGIPLLASMVALAKARKTRALINDYLHVVEDRSTHTTGRDLSPPISVAYDNEADHGINGHESSNRSFLAPSTPQLSLETLSHSTDVVNPPMLCKVAFAHLSYWTPLPPRSRHRGLSRGKQILRDVSACLSPGVSAVMGPSGCGKTTLLNLLSGHAQAGTLSGSRLLNGRAVERRVYDSFMRQQGYVRQSGILFEGLTVWETLVYSAMLRLPKVSPALQLRRARELMEELALESVANSQVGGETVKGVSGGQRRRLSIALQLLCLPSVRLC